MCAFSYKARPQEKWNKHAEGNNYEGFVKDEYTTFNPKLKENAVRILPPTWDNPAHYGLEIFVHYGACPSGATVLCLYRMKNQKCPICAAQARAVEQGNEKLASELRPTRRFLVWMYDAKEPKKPMLWAMPQTIDKEFCKIAKDRTTGQIIQIDHHEYGYDLYFDKEQKGKENTNVEYGGYVLARNATPVANPEFLDYIEQHPVPNCLNWRDYETVRALFEGGGDETVVPPPAASDVAAPLPPSSFQPPAAQLPAPAPPPAPPQPFVSQWTGKHCSAPGCGQPQFTTPGGDSCANGHGGAPALEDLAPPPQPVAVAPPPQPVVVAPPQPAYVPQPIAARPVTPAPPSVAPPPNGGAAPPSRPSSASAMRNRFTTGGK